jgi:hypothetical protein
MTMAPPGVVPLTLMYLLETWEEAPCRRSYSRIERFRCHSSTSWPETVCYEENKLEWRNRMKENGKRKALKTNM